MAKQVVVICSSQMKSQCKVCSSGQYQHQTQQTTCIDCPAGTVRYSNTVDGTSWNGATNNDIANTKADCKVCPSGRYQNEAGTTDCKHCPAGTIRCRQQRITNFGMAKQVVVICSSQMKKDCKVCSSSQYQHQTEQTTCIDCPAGTVRYSDTVDGTSWNGATNNDIANAKADCKVCPSGRYQNEAGTTDYSFPAGTMRAADSAKDNQFWDGQTSSSNMFVADEKADCKVCSSGQYQHQTEQTTCIDCPAGTVRYSDTVDGTSWNGATNNDIANAKADCKVCPSGRYQNEAGTTDCKHCPAGTMRAADSAKDNQFWDGQTSSSNMFVADEKADCRCVLAANTNVKPNKLPA